jgi:molybdate transport system substrate-binding protein
MNNTLLRTAAMLFCLMAGLYTSSVFAREITIAAANSTCGVLQQVGGLFAQRTGHSIQYLCKASGQLAKGLKGKAISADLFLSASKRWMDFMVESALVEPGQVVSPWGNELVVAAPRASPLEIEEWVELASPRVKTILIGDPGTAPFGRYAKQALQHTGIWEQVKSKITTKKHITLLADALAEADDATVGILFDSNVSSKHKRLCAVDEAWHAPIRYYAAPLTAAADNAAAIEMLRFMQGDEAQAIFRAAGFRIYAP